MKTFIVLAALLLSAVAYADDKINYIYGHATDTLIIIPLAGQSVADACTAAKTLPYAASVTKIQIITDSTVAYIECKEFDYD